MRRSQPLRRLAAALLFGATLVAPIRGGAETPATDTARPLRVCADPDDMPFSSDKAGKPGMYLEMAQAIAQFLGRPLEPVWWRSNFGAFTVRSTLLAKQCDMYVGLPRGGFMGPKLIFSKPFMHAGYAVMTSADVHMAGPADLVGKRVAVQYGSTPQLLLARYDTITSVTYMNPEEAAQALAKHEVDAAFIWGPSAGYINATAAQGQYEVMPVDGDGLLFPVAIGFNRADNALRADVDRFIDGFKAGIQALAAKYGLPLQKPVRFDQPERLTFVSSSDEEAPDAVKEGHQIFNGTCSHCHGPDAVQSVKKIDLRLLRRRYGDDMENVYHTTVTQGRPSKGMPNWTGVFTEDQFKQIFAFLKTVQTP